MSVKLVLLNYVLLVIFGEINCPGVFKSYQSQDGQGDSRDLDEIEAGQNVQFIEQRLTSKGPEREYLDLDKFQSFIVSVQTSENGVRKICSGSVLTRNTVLCPAHCVCYNNTDQPLPIRQITIMQQIHNEFVETEVKSVQIHSEYYSYLYQHDLAILEAEEALLVVQDVDDEGNLAVAPRVTVNLASEEIYRGSTPEEVFNTGCWSVGWFLVEGSLKSVEYKAWPVYLMSQQECQKAWTDAEEMIFVTSSHVCTHNVNQVIVGQDIGRNAKTSNGCNRNLGDVLMCNNVQIAVKTNGGTDCFDRKPTLWTRVDKYHHFIEKLPEENDKSFQLRKLLGVRIYEKKPKVKKYKYVDDPQDYNRPVVYLQGKGDQDKGNDNGNGKDNDKGDQDSGGKKKGLTIWQIMVIVIGVILLLAIITGIVLCCIYCCDCCCQRQAYCYSC